MARITVGPDGRLPELTEEQKEELFQQFLEMEGGMDMLQERMRAAAKTLSQLTKDKPRLLERYNNQWVGYYDCRFQAHGDRMEDVLKKMDEKGIPRGGSVIEYITHKSTHPGDSFTD